MMKRILALGLVYASLVSAVSACKSGDGGTGGTGGTGGSSTGTITGTGGCGQCWPQCFLDMFADCTPSGTCTQEAATSGTSITANACYENGVKMSSVTDLAGGSATLTYYKTDGSACFSATSTFTAASSTATYKDPNGNTLLTVTATTGSAVQTITCDGQTYTVDPDSAACKSCQTGDTTGGGCAKGTCAVP